MPTPIAPADLIALVDAQGRAAAGRYTLIPVRGGADLGTAPGQDHAKPSCPTLSKWLQSVPGIPAGWPAGYVNPEVFHAR